jgi:hypothetical protein
MGPAAAPSTARWLVSAVAELRLLAANLGALGALGVVLDLGAGHLGRLSPLETAGVLLVFGLSVGGTLASLVLGRRTGPAMLYRRVLDRAPPPPPNARPEPARRTTARAVGVALAMAIAFAVAATVLQALSITIMGKPRDEVPDHLVQAAALVAAGWLLVCAAAARVIARWFERWERARHKTVLCAPLQSATLGEVYFVA